METWVTKYQLTDFLIQSTAQSKNSNQVELKNPDCVCVLVINNLESNLIKFWWQLSRDIMGIKFGYLIWEEINEPQIWGFVNSETFIFDGTDRIDRTNLKIELIEFIHQIGVKIEKFQKTGLMVYAN